MRFLVAEPAMRNPLRQKKPYRAGTAIVVRSPRIHSLTEAAEGDSVRDNHSDAKD